MIMEVACFRRVAARELETKAARQSRRMSTCRYRKRVRTTTFVRTVTAVKTAPPSLSLASVRRHPTSVSPAASAAVSPASQTVDQSTSTLRILATTRTQTTCYLTMEYCLQMDEQRWALLTKSLIQVHK